MLYICVYGICASCGTIHEWWIHVERSYHVERSMVDSCGTILWFTCGALYLSFLEPGSWGYLGLYDYIHLACLTPHCNSPPTTESLCGVVTRADVCVLRRPYASCGTIRVEGSMIYMCGVVTESLCGVVTSC